jgi:hypothetical protein
MRRIFKNLFGSQAKAETRGARKPLYRPQLEQLEDRRLLTTFGNLSAIADSSGQSVSYNIAADHSVWKHDNAGWHSLGGYVTQISAGRDNLGRAEVFGIGADQACWVCDTTGWHSLGGYVTQISGDFSLNRVYAIGSDHSAWMRDGTGWHGLGGYVTQISAGTAAGGSAIKLFAIGADSACWQFDANGWQSLGLRVTQVCGAATPDECWMIDVNHAVWQYTTSNSGNAAGSSYGYSGQSGARLTYIGGYMTALAAGYDTAGRDEIFAIGADHAAWVYNPQAGGGWRSLGGNVTDISATQGDTLFALTGGSSLWSHDAGGWHNYSGFSVYGTYLATASTTRFVTV